MYDGLGCSTMLATDPPSVTASAASGQRRSSKAEASRAQPNTRNPHMIMGASSPPGHAHRDRNRRAVPGRLPAGVCPRATAAPCRWVRGQMRRPRGLRHLLPMNATIEIDGLRKRFGSTQALDGMTFTVGPGQVTGFVGPNGAGKSTTMRVVVGLDAPDAGTATIGGRPYHSLKNPLGHVGSLLDAGRIAAQPQRAQPPAVARPLPGPQGRPGR